VAKSSNYRVKLRRRREGRTDYQARKALIISGKPRLVTRASIKNITVQIVTAKPKGDEVLAAANSRELIKNFGGKAPTGNTPAGYLTGYLAGLKAKAAGVEEAIYDIGLVAPTKGSKIFAVLNGVLDAGIEIPHGEEKIVKERAKGEHISQYAKSIGLGSEEYAAKFSQYKAQGVPPEKIPEHFNKVKSEITAKFSGAKTPEIVVEPAPAPKVETPKVETPKAPKQKALKEVPKEEIVPQEKITKEKSPTKVAAPKAALKGKTAKAKVSKEKGPKEKAAKATKATPKEEATKPKAKAQKSPKEKAPKAKAPKKGEKKA
jgi:large subunit ribosomal protein L18